LLVYAGVLVALVVEVIRGRRWVWGIAIAGVILGGMGLQQVAAGSGAMQQIERAPRLSDYFAALRIALADDDVEFAISIVENAEVSHPTTPDFHQGLGDYFDWAGDKSRAAAHYRRAQMMTGNDPKMRESLRTRLQKLD
ncbi:MAG: hypothetical protein JRG84_12305, partial [Deltaproteobacteria bacterium]|nr:hypothetical protein [Deltaproteobacteria bacterium]